MLRWAFARPGVTVAGAVFAAVMTGIVTNAVLFQKGRHPSPLLGNGATAEPAAVPLPPRAVRQTAEAVPVLPVSGPPLAPPVVATLPAASAPLAGRHPVIAPPRKAASHSDPIRGLLSQDAAPSPLGRSSKAGDPVRNPSRPNASQPKPVIHAVAGRAALKPTKTLANAATAVPR